MANLAKWGIADSPDCPFCPGTVELILHWQCTCPQFSDSRIAAHNSIWKVMAALIRRAAPRHWTFRHETPMHSSDFAHSLA
eukprot:234505-Rhodomonas_salina.2